MGYGGRDAYNMLAIKSLEARDRQFAICLQEYIVPHRNLYAYHKYHVNGW